VYYAKIFRNEYKILIRKMEDKITRKIYAHVPKNKINDKSKRDVRLRIGFSWFRIGTNGEIM